MSKYVYLNNKYVSYKDAKIHIEDRGFQFSDSVYEVIKVINGKLLDIEFHLSRLKYSTGELNFNFKINKSSLKNIFLNLVKKNQLKNGPDLPVELQLQRQGRGCKVREGL